MDRQSRDTVGNRLLADLEDVSGLPLDELRFLGKWGLLRTYLAKIPSERYTLEEWRAGLGVLYDRRVRFASMDEVESWLAGLAHESESNERPGDGPF